MRRLLVAVGLLLIITCDQAPEFDNPLDPENPDFTPPETFFTLVPEENEVIDSSSITVAWEGNELVLEYSFNLDDGGWTDWSSVTTVTLDYLDEGFHNFQVKGRYESLDVDESAAEVNFEIDAIHGPAARIFPLKTEANVGQEISVYLYAEEVENLVGAEFDLYYNPLITNYLSTQQGQLLDDFTGESVFITEHNSGEGHIRITFAVAVGEDAGLNNTGDLAVITFQTVSLGSFTFEISETSIFRDYNNTEIPINDRVNGVVVVE